jgi:hypothetical protein
MMRMKCSDDNDDPRRRLLIQALSAAYLASVGLESKAQSGFFGSRPVQLPPGRSIFRMSGIVTVSGNPATMQTRINASDTVETSSDGEVVFAVGGNAMILRGGSKLDLSAQSQGSFLINGLRLLTGKLLSVSRNQNMRLITTTATVGIQGTGFYVESDPAETYFCTCYGATEVTANEDPNSKETVAATHHDHPVYIVSGEQSGRNIRSAEPRNHTDQELMLIETLVGRAVPFVIPSGTSNTPRRRY